MEMDGQVEEKKRRAGEAGAAPFVAAPPKRQGLATGMTTPALTPLLAPIMACLGACRPVHSPGE